MYQKAIILALYCRPRLPIRPGIFHSSLRCLSSSRLLKRMKQSTFRNSIWSGPVWQRQIWLPLFGLLFPGTVKHQLDTAEVA